MNAQPLVSVLVPVYNDARHLPHALASVLAQTEQDFEIVVSDDASTDETAAVAAEWATRDARIRILRQPTNLGMTGNWNAALAAARGEYVCKLDSDDAYAPQMLAELLAAFRSDPSIRAAWCRTLQCDADLVPVASYLGDVAFHRARLDPLRHHVRNGHAWYRLAFDDIQLWHSNAGMYRTVDLRAWGGWDDHYGCASDTDLILRVLERDLRVAHVPYAGTMYRIRAGSVSDTYRRSTLLAFESSVVHLLSLQRYLGVGGLLTPPLCFAWSRMWDLHQRLRREGAGSSGSDASDRIVSLGRAADRVTIPPATVRLRGWRGRFTNGLRRILQRTAGDAPTSSAALP